MALVPEHPVVDAVVVSLDAAQQFLRDWQLARAPVEGFAIGSATYRQPGGVVITNQAAIADPPHWWRLALHDAGEAVGTYVLAHQVAAKPLTDDRRWYGLVDIAGDDETIPVRRDEVEIRLSTLLDVLTAHAVNVGAGGTALIMTMLVSPGSGARTRVALVNELVDDSGQRQGWALASARARQPFDNAVMVPIVHRVRLADMREATIRLRAAHRLAADLLAIFGIDQPTMLGAEGTLDPHGVATDHDQMVYQHARHLGLPVDPMSPTERRQRYEDAVRAAKEQVRLR
jgi:hypothetical protein